MISSYRHDSTLGEHLANPRRTSAVVFEGDRVADTMRSRRSASRDVRRSDEWLPFMNRCIPSRPERLLQIASLHRVKAESQSFRLFEAATYIELVLPQESDVSSKGGIDCRTRAYSCVQRVADTEGREWIHR